MWRGEWRTSPREKDKVSLFLGLLIGKMPLHPTFQVGRCGNQDEEEQEPAFICPSLLSILPSIRQVQNGNLEICSQWDNSPDLVRWLKKTVLYFKTETLHPYQVKLVVIILKSDFSSYWYKNEYYIKVGQADLNQFLRNGPKVTGGISILFSSSPGTFYFMDAIAQPCYVHIAREESKVVIELTHGGYESL